MRLHGASQIPTQPYDAIVSALAIHHVGHPAKRELFVRMHELLRPGGAFVNAEHVAGPTPWLGAWVAIAQTCRFGRFQGVKSQGVVARRPAASIYERAK